MNQTENCYYRNNAVQFYFQINQRLQKRCDYRLSKNKIAGSIGKSTTIVSSDVDLIVFLWISRPDLDSKEIDVLLSEALDDFEVVLRRFNIQYPIKDITKTVCSLKFTVRNIKFDLLPAIDFIGNQDDPKLQQQLTLDAMMPNLSRYVYRFSSSLAFSTVAFIEKQSAFAHDMARLAKFWYKSACIEKHVSGASYFMEMVTVHVVNQMTSFKHSEAFHIFLLQMMNFDHINIMFAKEFRDLDGHRPNANEQLPRVMDPSNPWQAFRR